jgi:two-component system, NarL family, sensor histidine kinase UhpB
MSLRFRLSIIICLLFLTSMLLGVGMLILTAKQRVAKEVSATATLTYQLLEALLPNIVDTASNPDHAFLLQQLRSLEETRHIQISISGPGHTPMPAPFLQEIAAPDWFIRMVETEAQEFSRPLDSFSGSTITIRTDQSDEIVEVWQETRTFMLSLLLVLLLLNGILYLIIGRWFKPVNTILGNLDRIEHGEFGGPLPSKALPELLVIAERIRKLGEVLQVSQEDNARLTRQSLVIQEEERRYLAQELHDEMGQSISAIKAIAFSIAERNNEDAMSREGALRIGNISNHVRDHISSMMRRLRPVVLDELGLVPALEHMVDEWNRNHGNCFCSLRTSGNCNRISNEQQIHLYRIVQEALTNVAAHSGAENVEINLDADSSLLLQITDDGKGFDSSSRSVGMGLSGMAERARALNGNWSLDTQPGAGVTIRLTFPLDEQSSP